MMCMTFLHDDGCLNSVTLCGTYMQDEGCLSSVKYLHDAGVAKQCDVLYDVSP